MIIRIVKMEFHKDQIPDFLNIFAENREKIRSFPGCHHLQMLQGVKDSGTIFTYSHWESEEDLNNYRNSELFGVVWGNTKKMFRSSPQAWSLTDQTEIDVHTL